MDNYQHLKIKSLNLSYLTSGEGKTGLVCFHGFGRNATDFIGLNLPDDVKVISINLPFHGATDFEKNDHQKTLTKTMLLDALKVLVKKEAVSNFFMCGYSLGGKAVLSLLENHELPILGVILFAPDGFKANPWYRFASQTKLGEALNRSNIKNPWVFKAFLKTSRRLGLASKRQLSFASEQMNSEKKRALVYNIWRAHRKLQPNLSLVEQTLVKTNIELEICVGKYDKIIPRKPIQNWSDKTSKASLEILRCGHVIGQNIIETKLTNLIQQQS